MGIALASAKFCPPLPPGVQKGAAPPDPARYQLRVYRDFAMMLFQDVCSNVLANLLVLAPGKAWLAVKRICGLIREDGTPAVPREALWKLAGRRILAFGFFVASVVLAVGAAYFLACAALATSILLWRWGNALVRWAATPEEEETTALTESPKFEPGA